ncbi:alpha/beta hydrolase [Rhodococcus sp. X156]|uniref:alpha/beta hydrolase n=1 Tax=Rhodococcus sp. X156 TaxID=2499145 RepID=UPI000FDB73B7|nr:alpha/beta hydrolase [Rhodococcus sp. X156]
MSDPRTVYAELTSGNLGAGPATTVAGGRSALAAELRTVADTRGQLVTLWFAGLGSASALRSLDQRSTDLGRADDDLSAAARLLGELATEQQRVHQVAGVLMQEWQRASQVLLPANPPLFELVTENVHSRLKEVQSIHRGELDRIARAFDGLAVQPAVGASASTPGDAALPAPGTQPAAVAAWWKSLTTEQQASLRSQHPDALSELDGLPPAVLDEVNRARLRRDHDSAQQQLDDADRRLRELGLSGTPDAMLLGSFPPEVRAAALDRATAEQLLQRTQQVDDAVRSAQAMAAQSPGTGPVQLLSYRSTGPGGLAISFGDPSLAKHVAVAVPGTSSGPGSPGLDQAAALRRAMDERDPGGSHATVQWVDYDAPDSIGDVQAVAQTGNAEKGAPTLVGDVAGWRAAAGAAQVGPPQHVTVVGHSYGSTVVGFAAQHGLAADDVALVGSPGVGATSADQLSPGRGHVWAGSAEHDPVVQLTRGSGLTSLPSGVGPYDPGFGSRQFEATSTDILENAHGGYYHEGTPSLRNLAAISTGDYDDVTAAKPWDTAAPKALALAGLEAAGDVAHGTARTVGELLQGDLDDARRSVAATGKEMVGDAADAAASIVGDRAEVLTAPVKAVKGVLGLLG